MLCAYAILRARDRPLDVTGLDGTPITARAAGRIAVVCSVHAGERLPPPDAQNVLAHERVVEAMMQGGPVLPVRFGTAFSSEQKLDDVMALNEEALSDALGHVDGCVELSVHVLLPAPENSETVPQTGRQYMLEKLAAEQALQRVRKNLHDALAPLAEDTALRVAPGPDLLFSAAYLVRRDKTEDFRRRLLDLTAAHDHLRTLCTGPWPPYHFVPKLVFPPPSPSSRSPSPSSSSVEASRA